MENIGKGARGAEGAQDRLLKIAEPSEALNLDKSALTWWGDYSSDRSPPDGAVELLKMRQGVVISDERRGAVDRRGDSRRSAAGCLGGTPPHARKDEVGTRAGFARGPELATRDVRRVGEREEPVGLRGLNRRKDDQHGAGGRPGGGTSKFPGYRGARNAAAAAEF